MILLISNSPQRYQILNSSGYKVKVIDNNFDESKVNVLANPREYVRQLARGKLNNYLENNKLNNDEDLILTADTIVY